MASYPVSHYRVVSHIFKILKNNTYINIIGKAFDKGVGKNNVGVGTSLGKH